MGDEKITILEACKILHRSEKQVRRYVTTGKLPAEKSEDGKYYILKSDAESLARHPDRLQEDKVARRITRLETRVDEIEKRLDSLSTHIDEIIEALYSMSAPPTAQPPPTTHAEPAKPSVAHSSAIPEELPEGTVTLRELAAEFGVNRSTLYEQIVKYRLEHISIPLATLGKPGTGDERFFTPTQAQNVRDWRATRPKRKRESGDD